MPAGRILYDPSVHAEPTGAPGNDYENIQSTPAMQGGLTAQGLGNLGRGLEQAGQAGFQTSGFFGQVAADDATNNFQDFSTKLLYGDPSKTTIGADGKPQVDRGYFGLKGGDALRARPDVEKQLDEQLKQTRSTLNSPDQQLIFDRDTRRFRMLMGERVGSHADREANTYAVGVNNATEKMAMDRIAINADDPDVVAHATEDLINARVKSAQVAGAGPEVVQEAQASGQKLALKAQLDAIAVKDPARAMRMLEEKKDIAGDQYDDLSKAYRSRADWQAGRAAGMEALRPGSTGQPVERKNPLEVASKLVGAEEHQNRTVISNFIGNVAGQRVDPVATPWCAAFVNAVLRQSGLQGSNSLAARSFLNVGTPVSGLPQQGDVVVFSRGGDPSKGHVAFYVGPGSTPGTVKVLGGNQGNSVGVAEYPTANVLGVRRMGPGDVGNTPQADAQAIQINRNDAVRRVLDQHLPPEQEAHALSYISQQAQAHALANDQDTARKKQISDAAETEYLNRASDPAAVIDPRKILADNRLLPGQAQHLFDFISKVQGESQHDRTTYGPKFYDLFKQTHAPEGSPDRITDPSQLEGHVGNGLTFAGYNQLRTEIMGKRTPDGEAEAKMKEQFLKNARAQITGTNEGIHIRDPKGDELYLKFMAQALPAYTKGRNDGKSAAQLLNPDSPDYVGKAITQFKRPMAQWTADMLAGGEATPAQGAQTYDNPNSLVMAVQGGKLSRAEGEKIALEKGWIRANVPKQPEPVIPLSR